MLPEPPKSITVKMDLRKYKWTKRFLILTPIFLVIAVFLTGGGHGYFQPMFLIFPFATFTCIGNNALTLINLTLAIIQFPVYGILIDKSNNKRMMSFIILIIHIVVSVIILKYANENWK